ncbi:MAG: sec-independent protein translocase protein TatC [Phycisphaerales bacterium]|nr:sec-independent protein translocase protein TatC [Phycisphaerales bacterium]MEA2734234.1 sec-independent protein translocase protein TatC [Humisphaera sp.]
MVEANKHSNPDDFRMTVGEHLEDLRRRLIYALIGFVIVACFCLYFGRSHIFWFFCKPLAQTLQEFGLPPQLSTDQIPDIFSAFLEISMITAAAISSPWILWQFWLFVAAGLYPHERKYITRYIPLSIGLLIGGMTFVYFFVLPWTLQFFIAFSIGVPLKLESSSPSQARLVPPTTQPSYIQVVNGRPHKPRDGQIWYDQQTSRVEAMFGGEPRVIRFSADNLIATDYKLPDYIDLVVGMLITFGLSFQLPLVVLALVRVGIVERETLKKSRHYVYFAIAVLACVITPGDYITGTVLLIGPLVALYELGVWLSREPKNKPAR